MLAGRQDTTKSTSEKWVAVFQNKGKANLTIMLKIVSFVLGVPESNAFVERIFSLMTIKWPDSRNRHSTELIKNELQISVIYHARTPLWLCIRTKDSLNLSRAAKNIHDKRRLGESCLSLFLFALEMFS